MHAPDCRTFCLASGGHQLPILRPGEQKLHLLFLTICAVPSPAQDIRVSSPEWAGHAIKRKKRTKPASPSQPVATAQSDLGRRHGTTAGLRPESRAACAAQKKRKLVEPSASAQVRMVDAPRGRRPRSRRLCAAASQREPRYGGGSYPVTPTVSDDSPMRRQ